MSDDLSTSSASREASTRRAGDSMATSPSSGAAALQTAQRDELAHQETVEYGTTHELFVTVTEAVASVTGTPAAELIPRVHEVVDTDALERIFRPLPDGRQRTGWVTFFLEGCRITIDSACKLRVYAPPADGGVDR